MRTWQLLCAGVGALILMGCSTKEPHFSEPESMKPMVTFWEDVYSKWDEDTVIFHDHTYMDLIYATEKLPRSEKVAISQKRDALYNTLLSLEEKQHSKIPLTPDEAKLLKLIKSKGHGDKLAGIADRLRTQRGLKNSFKAGLEESYYYLPHFEKLFEEAGFPKELAYLPHVESSFQNHARSTVGAGGMWQFMPRTAQSYMPMYRGTYDGRFDPFVAAKGAVNYLKDSYTVAESWPLAITSYNHGLGGVLKARDAHGDDIGEIVWNYKGDRFGFASRNFYAEFLAAKKIAKSPERYFADINPKHYPAIEGIRLTKPMTVQELSSKIGIEDAELIRLNPAWLANIRNNRRAIPPQTDIWVPKGTHIQLADRSFYEPGDFHDL